MKYLSIQAHGNSMVPLLKDGDTVYVAPIHFNKIQVNDIIVFIKSQKMIVHRVIYKSDRFVYTKGDTNTYYDGKIHPSQIIGKVNKIGRGKKIFPLEYSYFAQSVIYFKEIQKISTVFRKNNIQYIILKGLPVHLYYGNSTPERHYADCDILVHPKQYKKASALLTVIGYKSSSNDIEKILLAPFAMEKEFTLYTPSFYVTIDLHKEPFSFVGKLGFPDSLYPSQLTKKLHDELFYTAVHARVISTRLPLLNIHFLVLFQMVNLYTHNMRGLHRIHTIKNLISRHIRNKSDWVNILRVVHDYKFEKIIFVVFTLLNRVSPKLIPRWVIQRIKTGRTIRASIQSYGIDQILMGESKFQRGLNKFILMFQLSPVPLYKRVLVIFSPSLFVLALSLIISKSTHRFISEAKRLLLY